MLLMSEFYYHHSSNRIYEVTGRVDGIVSYRAIGNGGDRFKLSNNAFASKLFDLTTSEERMIEKYRIELETLNSEVNRELIGKLDVHDRDLDRGPDAIKAIFRKCSSGPGELIRPKYTLDRLILDPAVMAEVRAVISSIGNRARIDEVFQMHTVTDVRRSVYAFYGPPGTGKTSGIHAVAGKLGRLLYKVDYGMIHSSADRKEIFARAERYNAVLFLDEADALCAARTFWPSASAQRLNADKNVFFQSLDAYSGPVLMSTNLINHFDEALVRRIGRHVKIGLPGLSERKQIFALHLPRVPNVQVHAGQVAAHSDGLSGGDIQNACFNAIDSACLGSLPPTAWEVTTEMVKLEIEKIRKVKADNLAGNRAAMRNRPDGGEE